MIYIMVYATRELDQSADPDRHPDRRLSLCRHAGAGVSGALYARGLARARLGRVFHLWASGRRRGVGALAVAAIVGANRIGPTLFEALGFVCGLYLCYLGARALIIRKDAPPKTIGGERPLTTGMAFGLTNPKSYPVALAMFSAIVAPYIGALHAADAPQMFLAAFAGFLLADATLIFTAGLPAVRKFFLTHGVAVTRVVGVIFILFGARSIADAAGGAMKRTA